MAIACRDSVLPVRKEAIYALATTIIVLCNQDELSLVRTLLLQYDVEATLLDVLRNNYIPESQLIALQVFQNLF